MEPHRSSTVLGLLDHFVVEVPWEEADRAPVIGRSWHAKAALVRYVDEVDPEVSPRWCLWIGSRNLSRDESWDIGLSIEGYADRNAVGERIPSAVEFATRLAAQAGQSAEWTPLVDELKRVRWDIPRGLSIDHIRLATPEDGDKKRRFPKLPDGVRRIVAVAPFLDGQTVKTIAKATPDADERQLLSTRNALAKIAEQTSRPLSGFNLLALPEPSDVVIAVETQSEGPSDAAVESRGLHAKFLWVEHASGSSLWLGSPNLTDRGWTKNAEAYAKIDVAYKGSPVATKALIEGIEAFVGHAKNLNPEDLEAAASLDADEERLETGRKQVAARLIATQTRQPDGSVIVRCPEAPHADEALLSLEVARLAGSFVLWPTGSATVTLPVATEARDSDLVRVRLRLGERNVTWVQRAEFDPRLAESRDDAVLGDYLGVRGLLALISDLLTDLPSTGDAPWDMTEEEKRRSHRHGVPVGDDLPSLEQILRTWVRDPTRVRDAAAALRIAKNSQSTSEDDQQAYKHLQSLLKSWDVLDRFLKREVQP